MSNNVGGANIEITADDKQARSTFERFGRYLDKFGRTGKGFSNAGFSFFRKMEQQMRATQSVLENIDRTLNNMNQRLNESTRSFNKFSESSRNAQRQNSQAYREYRENVQAAKSALLGTEHVLGNMNRRLNESTEHFKQFNQASNNIQAQYAFSRIEGAIRKTNKELSMLGFGKTKTEIQALEGQLYNFANVRMDNLRDQIKLTERALVQMKNSADASKYAEQIKAAEAALASYKRQLQDANALQKMAAVNGYSVMKVFGKDVFVKPLQGFQQFKAQVTGFFNTDLARLANYTYQHIDKAAKAIVGSTDTIAEQKRKIQQLATMYQTLGTTINTMVTPFVLALGAAFAYVGAKAEQAYYKFEAQTLTPRADMKEYKNAMADVYAETGQAREEISKVFAFLKNKYDATAEAAKSLATKGADFSDIWGSGDAQTSIQSIETMRKTMRLLKVDEEQAANALALALKRTNGNWEEATKSLTQYGDIYKKLVSGQKITEVDARAAAERNVTKAVREQSQEYTRLQREKKRLEKQRDATKDPKQQAFIDQAISNVENDMKRLQQNLGKGREEMLQREIKMMMQLQELDPLNAYQNMGDAEGAVESMLKAWRNFANVIEELFDALAPTIEAVGNKLTDMTEAATEFLRNNPGFASFVAHMMAAGTALTILVGVFAPVAGLLIRNRALFQALSQSMVAAGTGASAVLAPAVVALQKRFTLFTNAIAGLPRLIGAAFPALLTIFRILPGMVAKFIVQFVKLNPMLTAFSLLATVIINNWERVGPVLSQIWKDVLLAFQPLREAFNSANSTLWPTLMKLLNQVSEIAGGVLVDALKTIEPVIRAIALAINGDFKGALSAFNELKDQAVTVGSVLGSVAIAWAGYKTAVTIATLATEAHLIAQRAVITGSALMSTGITRATGALAAMRLALVSHPVGLIVTALSVAAGAATLFANQTAEAKEVTFEQVDALNKQRSALESTVKEYESLRGSIKLSEPELLRYMDLQKQIARETDPTHLQMLKKEQEELAKKSGVTVEQLEHFFRINGDLIQQAPATEQAISAEGAALAKSADAAKALTAELAKKTQLELESQKANADAELGRNLQKQIELAQKLNTLEGERVQKSKDINNLKEQLKQAEVELQKAQESGGFFEERAARIKRDNLNSTLSLRQKELALMIEQQVATEKEYQALEQNLQKTKQIYEVLIQRQAQQAGINAEVGKEVQKIDEALKAHIKTRDALLEQKEAGKGLNAEKQKELEKTNQQIEKLNEAKGNIQGLQKEQAEVNKKIKEGEERAGLLNEELGKKVEKPVDGKQIDDNKKKAGDLNKELQKPATKQVNVQVDDSPLKRLMDWLKVPFTKTINFVENITKQVKEIKLPSLPFFGNKRHQGGTVHELPKFHKGGSPALLANPPKANEVDVRLLRNEMVLTKEQQANLFNMIKAFKGVVAKRVTDAKSIVDGVNKMLSQATQKLSSPQEDAVISKTMAEIRKNAAVASKGGSKQQQRTTDNKAFAEAKKTAEFKFDKGIINAQQYIAVLKQIDAQYAKTPEHHRQVSEAISKAEAARTKVTSEQAKKQFEESKKWIDERKFYGELTLEQELAAWNRAIAKLQKGTEEYANAQKEIYRVKQEIERESFENSKRWIDEQKYYNKLSLEEELAAWQRVQSRYKVGTEQRKQSDREVYRVLTEIAEKEYRDTIESIDKKMKEEQEDADRRKKDLERRRNEALDSLKREEKAEMDSLDRRQKAYERDHQARMKMLDDETNAAIKRIQAEIDAIDRQGRDEDYANKDADRQKELAELRKQYDKYKVSASAKGQKKAADLLKQIEGIETEIARDEQARRREQLKDSLKEQIDNIKEAADQKKEQWQLEFDRQREWFEQEKEQRQAYYQQRQEQTNLFYDQEIYDLEQSTQKKIDGWQKEKDIAEQTRTQMLEDARKKALENLNIVESGQQQAINVLQSKNQDYYRSGQTLGNMFAYGLESSASRVKEAVNKIAKIVSNRLELHSPAKEGPLATLNKWWNALPETLLAGLDTRVISSALDEMVNPNLSFASLGAAGLRATITGAGNHDETNYNGPLVNIENFYGRDDRDIRTLGEGVGHVLNNQRIMSDRARGRKK